MPFTDHSDIYASLHEEGLNDVVSQIERKRPSLFNYASGQIADNPDEYLCRPLDVAPEVKERRDLLVRRMNPVPVIGTSGAVALDFCFQLTELTLDFHPRNTIVIPDEADLTIEGQQFGVFVRVCAGLACPDEDTIIDLTRDLEQPQTPEGGPFVPKPERVHCFCLDAYLTGGLKFRSPGARTSTVSIEDSPEFTVLDVEATAAEFEDEQLPKGLREAAECYLQSVVNFALLPRLASAVEKIVPMLVRMLDGVLSDLGATLAITTPTTPAIPNNPAVEDDELRLFVDLRVGVTP